MLISGLKGLSNWKGMLRSGKQRFVRNKEGNDFLENDTGGDYHDEHTSLLTV